MTLSTNKSKSEILGGLGRKKTCISLSFEMQLAAAPQPIATPIA
jgi:hypothetical protein